LKDTLSELLLQLFSEHPLRERIPVGFVLFPITAGFSPELF
jgi:hypothetical protein